MNRTCHLNDALSCRSHALLLNEAFKSVLSSTIRLALAIKATSLSLSMRARLTVEHHIEGMHGQSRAIVQCAKLFLYAVEGVLLLHSFISSISPSSIAYLFVRYSILPAMSLDGILAVDIVEGSFNKIRFARFIDGLLHQMNPYPLPNSVIVMDNCRIHKCPEVLEMINDRYVFLFLFLICGLSILS